MIEKLPMLNLSLKRLHFYRMKISAKLVAGYFWVSRKTKTPEKGLFAGLAGCGNFARNAYVPAFNRKMMPVVISGFFSNNPKSSEKTQKMLRYKTRLFLSYEELLDSGIRAVILTLPNHLHYQYILKALEKDMDVFCEKPVTNNLSDAMRLYKYLNGARNILMIGFNQRYMDRIKKVKLIIENNELGDIHEIDAFHNQDIAEYLKKSSWLSDSWKSGGGVLYSAGIHLVNLLLYLFGPIDAVTARLECRKSPEIFGEDTADCEFYFKSGVKGRLAASYINGVNSSYEHIVIRGSKGVVYTDMKTSSIMHRSVHDFKWRNIYCKKELVTDSVFNELLHFYNCVEKQIKPDTDIVDSINTLNVIKAAHLSSLEKRRVLVE